MLSPGASAPIRPPAAGGRCAPCWSGKTSRRRGISSRCASASRPKSRRGEEAIDAWPLDADGFELLRPGLRRAYSRARKSFRKAREKPSDERLHEWRKRSKDLWYQLRLIRRAWPAVISAMADEAHRLSDLLGDDHDLVVLRDHVDGAGTTLTAEQRSHLSRLIAARREELQAEAFAYGERLLAEKPKRFVKRVERYWSAGEL